MRNRVQRAITCLDRTFGLGCGLVKRTRKKAQNRVIMGYRPLGSELSDKKKNHVFRVPNWHHVSNFIEFRQMVFK
jgi:hypothetical protein